MPDCGQYIFSTFLGDKEAGGRIGSGVIELLTAVLLLYARTTWRGALLALTTASGAMKFTAYEAKGIEPFITSSRGTWLMPSFLLI